MELLCRMIADEKVTFTCGVPTIWMMLYQYLESGGTYNFSSLKSIASGGAPCPRFLMEGLNEKYGFPIIQAYGMTETTPLALAAIPKSYMADLPKEQLYDVKTSIGLLALGLEMKIANERGEEVKMDGREWGKSSSKDPGLPRNMTGIRSVQSRCLRAAGFIPATWEPSMKRATSGLWTEPKISSRAVVNGFHR